MEILSQTRSYCNKCAAFHEAFYRQDGSNVFFTVDCPKVPFQHLVSDDAALFRTIRGKAGFDPHEELPSHLRGKKRFNMLPITNRCNFKCNICYASANTEQDIEQLSPEEIFRLAPEVKKAGGNTLVITGGEPTLHPDLFVIIKGLRKRGLYVNLPTNGYRVGTEQNYAARLKASGLNIITFSFDTLKENIQQLYRNNPYIAEKVQALHNARAAGLRIVAIMTSSKYNIEETGSVVKFLAGYAPALSIVILQPYFFTVNQNDSNAVFNADKVVRREAIINALVRSGAIEGLSQDHFWPLPQLNMAIHPDCGAVAILAVVQGKIFPLDRIVAMKKYYALLGGRGKKIRPALLPLAQIKAALQSTKPGKHLQVLKCFYGFLTGRGKHSLLIIAVEGFMDSAYQDEDKCKRCASAMWRKEGMVEQLGCLVSLGMND